MKLERSSGILLHPSSLPGLYGIGDIGTQGQRWIDFLVEAGCTWWQILPLGQTGYGDSPYQCFSAFAGNPYLISLESLLAEGFLQLEDLEDLPEFPEEQVDFGRLIPWKLALLDRAYLRFEHSASSDLRIELADFRAEQANWLEDFALFMALKEAHDGAPWSSWEKSLRWRNPQVLEAVRLRFMDAIQRQIFRQFLFFRQWYDLHQYALRNGIYIMGDVPIFVAHDSTDVWTHPELFYLNKAGQPRVVAGVPPDYFSPTGQLWGNPLYRWKAHKASGYEWWLDRLRSTLSMVDFVRLDHFRGFCGYWEVPGYANTAERGRWVRGPGKNFFKKVAAELKDMPFIAEDLGVITPDVVELRKLYGLPGMKVLQFAFGNNPKDAFLPHNYPVECVAYTGTHDNDTARGWYERVPEIEKSFYRRYLNRDGQDVAWDLIRACWSSVAVLSIAPIQDFLDLGNDARMNYPGNPNGNWSWRMRGDVLKEDLAGKIREINYLFDRLGGIQRDKELF
jgi:4-alpha-glucanotransferase